MDIVTRLRASFIPLSNEAADIIEDQRARLDVQTGRVADLAETMQDMRASLDDAEQSRMAMRKEITDMLSASMHHMVMPPGLLARIDAQMADAKLASLLKQRRDRRCEQVAVALDRRCGPSDRRGNKGF